MNMWGKTRGKQALKDFISRVRLQRNAVDIFYPKREYLSCVYCVMMHNELSGIVSNVENIDYRLSVWTIRLSRETIEWAIEILDAQNLLNWE